MKRHSKAKGRTIWNEEESTFLVNLVKENKSLCWSKVANCLSEKFQCKKTGKQCRERYRNYDNPKLQKSEWRPQEKLLFIVMHQVFGNQWSNISRYLNCRGDVPIKNYYYYQVRKSIRHLKQNKVPVSVVKKGEKLYKFISILRRIQEYLPAINVIDTLPKYSHKEKIILNLLRDRKVTEQEIDDYINLLLNQFIKLHHHALPIEISLSLTQTTISTKAAQELISKHDVYNVLPLRRAVVVRVYNEEVEQSTSLKKPITFYQQIDPCFHLNPILQIAYNTLPLQQIQNYPLFPTNNPILIPMGSTLYWNRNMLNATIPLIIKEQQVKEGFVLIRN
jgi:hypothetical protein